MRVVIRGPNGAGKVLHAFMYSPAERRTYPSSFLFFPPLFFSFLISPPPQITFQSTLLKALTGALPLARGSRFEDERLSLGMFAQDLAQELPPLAVAVDYVTSVARQHDSLITDAQARSVMGSLGLSGAKATRPIGTLSGGEKARVALATFCLTPHNVLLLDEPVRARSSFLYSLSLNL
jgi:ABC-type cobalamin transport system ATPase subunit